MPKLRPARTKEEAELVPPTEGVEIILAPEGEAPPEPKQEDPKKPEVKAKPEPEEQDDPVKLLKEQLEQAKNAETAARAAEAAARQQAQEALAERDRSAAQSTQHQQAAEDARYTAVVNALGAASSEAEAAQQAWEAADVAGDSKAKAEAQRRLSRAEANVARFEDAKENLEQQREAKKNEPVPRVEPKPTDPVEQAIAGMPAGAQTWLRSHPEFISDARKNAKLQSVHWDVLDEGHPQFSNAYFESLETHLGLRQKPAVVDPEEEPAPPPARSRAVTSAPPSRDVPSPTTGKPRPDRVDLTPEQREIARLAGIDDVTYARGVQELARRKGMGMYNERG